MPADSHRAPFEQVTVGFTVTQNIYVKADRKTVCAPTDKQVAFLKYGIGTVITPAQRAELIFPESRTETLPDAEQRVAETPDVEKRGGKRK